MYSVYISWHSIFTIFATLNLSYYVFNKGLVKFEDDRETFVISIQSLSATITLAFILAYLPVQSLINSAVRMPTSMMLCMLVQILFEPPVLYWTARKRFEYKYQPVIAVTLVLSVLNPLMGMLLILSGSFANAALARSLSLTIVSVVLGLTLGSVIVRRAGMLFSTKYWRYALAFNLPLVPHYLSTTVLSSADRIMIGNMVGNSEAAIYSVAYAIGMACTLFSQAIHQAYLPWLYKRMKKEEYTGIPRISNAFLVGMLGILTMIICFAPEVVSVVGSERYHDAIWAIPPICGSIFFIFLQNQFSNISYYFEKTRLIAAASVGVAVLNVTLNYLFIPMFGYLAAGYTTLVCYVVYAVVHYFVMRSICKENGIRVDKLFDLQAVVLLSCVTFAITILMLAVYRHTLARYSVILTVFLIALVNRHRLIGLAKTIKSNDS